MQYLAGGRLNGDADSTKASADLWETDQALKPHIDLSLVACCLWEGNISVGKVTASKRGHFLGTQP